MNRFNDEYTRLIVTLDNNKLINENIIDKFKLLATAGQEKLNRFTGKLKDNINHIWQQLFNSLIKPLINAIQNKDQKNNYSQKIIKEKLTESPLIKSIFSEIQIFDEIKNDFDVKSMITKSQLKPNKRVEQSINNYVNSVITER